MRTLRPAAAQATIRFLAGQAIVSETDPLAATGAGGLVAATGQCGANRLRESAGRPARGRLT
jgi:hypothetical protein